MKAKLAELKRAIELEPEGCRRDLLVRFYNVLVLKHNRRVSAGGKLKVDSQKQTQKDE